MIKFFPSVLNGSLQAPASKACAMRLMFATAMSATAATIENIPDCKDIRTAMNCLSAIGCKIECSGTERLTLRIEPFSKNATIKTVKLNYRESATTARFMTVIASAYGIPIDCQAEGTLLKRSQVSMTSRMALRGAIFSSFSFPLSMEGHLRGGHFDLEGNKGSQFISAMLMALPVLKDDSDIKLTSPLIDPSFVDMTIQTVEQFGIRIERTRDGFHIPGQQVYSAPRVLVCENDWGLASLWAAAGAACCLNGGQVSVTGLPKDSLQQYRSAANFFPLISQDFKDINIDAAEFPNLSSFLAALAAARGGTARLSGVPQLKYKESNRLKSIGFCMKDIGVNCEVNEDGLVISGKEDADYPEDMILDSMGDPWIFMSLALASVAFKKPYILRDEHCAEKIYAGFLDDLKKLGGKFEIIEDSI